jgi:hypothetical protein
MHLPVLPPGKRGLYQIAQRRACLSPHLLGESGLGSGVYPRHDAPAYQMRERGG